MGIWNNYFNNKFDNFTITRIQTYINSQFLKDVNGLGNMPMLKHQLSGLKGCQWSWKYDNAQTSILRFERICQCSWKYGNAQIRRFERIGQWSWKYGNAQIRWLKSQTLTCQAFQTSVCFNSGPKPRVLQSMS